MKKLISVFVFIAVTVSVTGCATHKKEILISGLVGAAAGAGLGYGVVHHGQRNQYEVQNTIITSSVVALLTMGTLSLHYYLMDQQKVEITSGLTSEWMKNPENQNKVMQLGDPSLKNPDFVTPTKEMLNATSLKLDDDTRWALPTFRKRELQPESGTDQITSARSVWEVVRPGFFVNRQTQPWYFEDSASRPSTTKETK